MACRGPKYRSRKIGSKWETLGLHSPPLDGGAGETGRSVWHRGFLEAKSTRLCGELELGDRRKVFKDSIPLSQVGKTEAQRRKALCPRSHSQPLN